MCLFQINAVVIYILLIKNAFQKFIVSPQKIVFNIDNNQKCFYYDFWSLCDTEDWSYDAENTALISEINYSLTHIYIENS